MAGGNVRLPSFLDSIDAYACLVLPAFEPNALDFVSPVSPVSLAAKGSGVVRFFLVFVVFWSVFFDFPCLVFGAFSSLRFLHALAFTDWCLVHRQQSREQKKGGNSLDQSILAVSKDFHTIVKVGIGFQLTALTPLTITGQLQDG